MHNNYELRLIIQLHINTSGAESRFGWMCSPVYVRARFRTYVGSPGILWYTISMISAQLLCGQI